MTVSIAQAAIINAVKMPQNASIRSDDVRSLWCTSSAAMLLAYASVIKIAVNAKKRSMLVNVTHAVVTAMPIATRALRCDTLFFKKVVLFASETVNALSAHIIA